MFGDGFLFSDHFGVAEEEEKEQSQAHRNLLWIEIASWFDQLGECVPELSVGIRVVAGEQPGKQSHYESPELGVDFLDAEFLGLLLVGFNELGLAGFNGADFAVFLYFPELVLEFELGNVVHALVGPDEVPESEGFEEIAVDQEGEEDEVIPDQSEEKPVVLRVA